MSVNVTYPVTTTTASSHQLPLFDREGAREWDRWQQRYAASSRRSDRRVRAVAAVVFVVSLGWIAIQLWR